jgi:DNA-binding Lrp family transcriptional regulator
MNYSKHRNDFERAVITSKLSANQKLVALVLKSHMNNDDGRCFPSIKTLETECSLSEKTVRNAIRELETAGFITKVIAGNGRGKSTQYKLNPIQSDVDNTNKHKGNPSTLVPNYSPDKDVNPSDFPQDDFEVEVQHETVNTYNRTTDVTSNVKKTAHLDVLELSHRRSALLHLEHYGYYFNEHYRKWLDANGYEVETDPEDF